MSKKVISIYLFVLSIGDREIMDPHLSCSWTKEAKNENRLSYICLIF